MKPLHIAVTRRVKHGNEAEFEEALRQFVQASLKGPGMTGVHLIAPSPDSTSREYGVLRSFDNEEDCRQFYASPVYQDWQRRVGPLCEGEPIRRRLHGFEAYFRYSHHGPPPRWKMALVTWLGVFPTVLLWSLILPGFLKGLPWLIAVAISNAFVVATLAWGAMPLLTRLFSDWLHNQAQDAAPPVAVPAEERHHTDTHGAHALPEHHGSARLALGDGEAA